MKMGLRILLVLAFASLSLVSAETFAQEILPQQSTSGPKPPPSVRDKRLMRMAPAAQGGASRVIAQVPAYAWRHGCGPTSLGMVLAYYDMHGFEDLFAGDSSTQTEDVNQAIASEGSGVRGSGLQKHYEDYALPMDAGEASVQLDRSILYPYGCHTSDSIADYMETSWSRRGNFYGWSWSSRVIPALTSYVNQQNPAYVCSSTQYDMSDGSLSWSVLTTEMDNNRPMVFLVDTVGDGKTDHFVTVVGYSDGPPHQYACLDTWYPYDSLRWCDFAQMESGQDWGISKAWSFTISADTAAHRWTGYE